MTKEELLNKVEKAGQDYQVEFHGCARCTLRAIQENLDLGDAWTLKAATPLSGGIAMRGEVCGALLGGIMALGMANASEDFSDVPSHSKAMTAAYRYWRTFVKELGSCHCRDIQVSRMGRYYDLSDIMQAEEATEKGLYREAAKVVGKAARLAAEMILEQREKKPLRSIIESQKKSGST